MVKANSFRYMCRIWSFK